MISGSFETSETQSVSGGWQNFDFLDFVDIYSDPANEIQISPNGEISGESKAFELQNNINLLIISKEKD